VDQIYQLQQQIQRMRQEINNIVQMTNQLQQAEQNNAANLSRLQQHESTASQQLQRIQQMCNQVSQDLGQVSNITQQITSGAISTMGMQPTTGFGAYGRSIGFNQYTTQQPGNIGGYGQITTGQQPTTYGSYAQYTPTTYSGYNQMGTGFGNQFSNINQPFTPGYNQGGYFTSSMAYSPNFNQNYLQQQNQQNLQNLRQFQQNQALSQQQNMLNQQRGGTSMTMNPGSFGTGQYAPTSFAGGFQNQATNQDQQQYQQNLALSQQQNQLNQQRYSIPSEYGYQ